MSEHVEFGDLNGPLAYWGPIAPVQKRHKIRVSALANPKAAHVPIADLGGVLYYWGPARPADPTPRSSESVPYYFVPALASSR